MSSLLSRAASGDLHVPRWPRLVRADDHKFSFLIAQHCYDFFFDPALHSLGARARRRWSVHLLRRRRRPHTAGPDPSAGAVVGWTRGARRHLARRPERHTRQRRPTQRHSHARRAWQRAGGPAGQRRVDRGGRRSRIQDPVARIRDAAVGSAGLERRARRATSGRGADLRERDRRGRQHDLLCHDATVRYRDRLHLHAQRVAGRRSRPTDAQPRQRELRARIGHAQHPVAGAVVHPARCHSRHLFRSLGRRKRAVSTGGHRRAVLLCRRWIPQRAARSESATRSRAAPTWTPMPRSGSGGGDQRRDEKVLCARRKTKKKKNDGTRCSSTLFAPTATRRPGNLRAPPRAHLSASSRIVRGRAVAVSASHLHEHGH